MSKTFTFRIDTEKWGSRIWRLMDATQRTLSYIYRQAKKALGYGAGTFVLSMIAGLLWHPFLYLMGVQEEYWMPFWTWLALGFTTLVFMVSAFLLWRKTWYGLKAGWRRSYRVLKEMHENYSNRRYCIECGEEMKRHYDAYGNRIDDGEAHERCKPPKTVERLELLCAHHHGFMKCFCSTEDKICYDLIDEVKACSGCQEYNSNFGVAWWNDSKICEKHREQNNLLAKKNNMEASHGWYSMGAGRAHDPKECGACQDAKAGIHRWRQCE